VLLLQHRLLIAIVTLALAVTAGVFLFARPEYRDPTPGKALVFPEAKAPAHGWSWEDKTPGFHFGEHNGEWNVSRLLPRELGATPGLRNLGVLQVLRTSQTGRPQVLLVGADASGRTCLGIQLHRGPVSSVCPPELDRVVGVVVSEAEPHNAMFLMGISRADVTRVTVEALGQTYVDHTGPKPVVRPFGAQTVYTRASVSWWGTFVQATAQPGPWHARVRFYGAHGRLASTDVRFRRPGDQFVLATP
jgi:hypothetical protein